MLHDRRAVEPLIAVLEGTDPGLSQWAATALGDIGDARAVEPLVKVASSLHDNLGETAVLAVVQLHDEGAIERALKAFAAGKDLEVLARLDVPGALELLLRSLFETPRPTVSLKRVADARPFGDWTDTILRASGYEQFVLDSVTLEGSPLGAEMISRTRWGHTTHREDAAVASLCASRSSVATNILHLVAQKPDTVVAVEQETFGDTQYETLSFADQRQCARNELTARGNPPYEVQLYQRKDAWDVSPDVVFSGTPGTDLAAE